MTDPDTPIIAFLDIYGTPVQIKNSLIRVKDDPEDLLLIEVGTEGHSSRARLTVAAVIGMSNILNSWLADKPGRFCRCSCGYVHSPDDWDRHFKAATKDWPGEEVHHVRIK